MTAAANRSAKQGGRVKAWLKVLGPGLVTGSADDDPSGIATYSQAGAAFQYGLLWTVFLQVPLMIAVQYTCARIGLVSGRDLGRVLREHYPVSLLWVVTVLLALANTITAGADIAAVGAAVEMVLHIRAMPVMVLVALLLVGVLVFGSYAVVSKMLKWLTLALFAYLVSGILAGARWSEVLRSSVVPGIRPSYQYLSLVVAVLGTTISPYMFIWQSGQEVDEQMEAGKRTLQERRGASDAKLRDARNDTIVGMSFSQLMSWFIMVAAGATLYPSGHRDIGTANEAAQALHPLGGGIGTALFSAGIVGTGLLAVPTLVGATAFAVAALARAKAGMSERPAHSKIFSASVAVGVVAAAAVAMSGMSPVAMLLTSATVNGVLAAPLLVVVLLVANNSAVMGDRRNGWLLNALVGAAAIFMGGAALWLVGWWVKMRL